MSILRNAMPSRQKQEFPFKLIYAMLSSIARIARSPTSSPLAFVFVFMAFDLQGFTYQRIHSHYITFTYISSIGSVLSVGSEFTKQNTIS